MSHDLLQIAFDWSDFHLHRFLIRGKEYGVSRMGCTTFTTDARKGLLSQFGFRVNERFSLRVMISAICGNIRSASKAFSPSAKRRSVRTKVLNENWRSTLSRWYPGMEETCDAKAA